MPTDVKVRGRGVKMTLWLKLPFSEKGRLRGTGLDGWSGNIRPPLTCSDQWDVTPDVR